MPVSGSRTRWWTSCARPRPVAARCCAGSRRRCTMRRGTWWPRCASSSTSAASGGNAGRGRAPLGPTMRAMGTSPTAGQRLQRVFLTGLLTLLPIWLTWVVVKFVFGLLSGLSQPFVTPALADLAAGNPRALGWLGDPWVQTALALLATVAVILLAGWMARRVLGQRLLRWFEALVARIPLASTIYGSARKLLDILQTQPDGTQRVVLIDFPHDKMK